MTYKFATGFNNAGGLATITPQPATVGIKPGRVITALDNSVQEDGISFIDLEYNVLSNAQYGTLLTLFGLTSVRSVEATMSLPGNSDRTSFSNYNVILQRVEDPNYKKGLWETAIFRAKIVEAL